MEYTVYVLIILGSFVFSEAQRIPIGCPVGWISHSTSCYKFADDYLRVYEVADAYCWSFGAKLLSVETYGEHKFVSDWLMANDVTRQAHWFTSGDYTIGRLYWAATNQYQDEPTYWINRPEINSINQDVRYKVVYTFGATNLNGYGWTNVTSSEPAYGICEILRADSGSIDVLDRGFDYGKGTTEPEDVERGPYVDIQPKNIVTLENARNIEMDCFASANPYPTYRWYYNTEVQAPTEITSSERYTLSSGVITIADPNEEDVGSYHCRAKNKYGTVMSNSASVIRGFLDGFQNIDPEPVYAEAFKGTKMDCGTPSHSPGVTYQWFKNAATNIFVWPSNGNMFVSYSGALYVSEVQPTDAKKRYYCIISLIAGDGYEMAKAFAPARTNLGLLLLLSKESTSDNDYGPILNTHAFPTQALVGRTIRLECVAYGTHPLFYSWKREDGRPFVEGTVISAKNRVLTIKNAPLEAEGNYICTCLRGSGARASKVISVSIAAKPFFPYPIKNMLVDPSMNIRWTCKAVARPAATYSWYKNSELLTDVPGHIRVRGGVLEILGVDKDRDEGMYQCGATNEHGTSFSTGQLKVLSFPPNFFRHPLPAITLVPSGGNVTIPCDVEAAPIPEVSWLKNGGNLNLVPGDMGGRTGMTTRYGLTLSPVEYSDQGMYTCEATNTLGRAADTTQLVVIEGIRIIRPPVSQTVLVNRTAFFYCEATYNTNYDLTYIWKFNGRVIDYKLSPEYISGRNQGVDGLYVTNVQNKHRGVYECEARTTLHSESARARLTVQGPPGTPAGVYSDDDAIVLERSVRLVWTVTTAMMRGGPINAYDVEAESNYKPGVWATVATDIPEYFVQTEAVNSGKRDDQRAFTVTDLIPNASYKFRVRAINVFGRGQEASIASTSIKIKATEPVIAPRNVGGGGGSVGTLTISWEPFDISEQCGSGIRYNVYWKLKDDVKDWKKSIARDAQALTHGEHTETVGEDNYYIEYQVMVQAENDLGPGPNSSVVFIYSAMGMPVSVPTILDADTVNATAVIINWIPVTDDRVNMKGRVEGYRIYYYQDKYGDQNALMKEPDPSKVYIKVKNVYGQKETSKAIGLKPNTDTYVRVQVFNSAGAGPKGEWRWTETFNYPVSAYPTHIKVYPHGLHSVTVRWRGVSIKAGEESLMGYIIRVWKIQQDVRTATDYKTEKVLSTVIEGLQQNTVYVLRVLGYSLAGDGAISEAIYFSVMGGSLPFDPTTSEVCYSDQDARTCDSGSGQLYTNTLLMLTAMLIALVWT